MKQFEVDHKIKCTIESKNQALEVINEFFHIYHPVEAKEEIRKLEQMVKAGKFSQSGNHQEDMLYFIEKLEEVLDAAAILALPLPNPSSS